MYKKLCTLFVLLVLSIQMMPVQQIGNALFSNSFTEELPHADDTCGCCEKAPCKSDYLSSSFLVAGPRLAGSAIVYYYKTEGIPLNHAAEVQVPPPNC